MTLSCEQPEDLILAAREHVEPWRHLIEARGEGGAIEDDEGAEHLCPGHPALLRSGYHDVAGSMLESPPSITVADRRRVADHCSHSCHSCLRVVFTLRAPHGVASLGCRG